jgi:hypothetical protein
MIGRDLLREDLLRPHVVGIGESTQRSSSSYCW